MNLYSSLLVLFCLTGLTSGSWDQWWTYDGISGPSFWGRLNLKWSLCSKGKKQSPLDIKPEQLLFDPILGPIDLSGGSVDGNLTNTGRGIVLRASLERREDSPECILSNGPLSYRYSFSHLELHFGREMTRGSEHSIDGQRFPGEVQLYFFNSGLYTNFEEASLRSHGVAAVAVLIQLNPDAKQANPSLKRITQALKNITSKGASQFMTAFSVDDLMPGDMRKKYITYEGSLTQPSCQETVQWIILNRPIYMTSHLFHSLRVSMSSDNSHGADNFRPTQGLNGRSIRTNIDFANSKSNVSNHVSSVNSLGTDASANKMCSMRRPLQYKGKTQKLTFSLQVFSLENRVFSKQDQDDNDNNTVTA